MNPQNRKAPVLDVEGNVQGWPIFFSAPREHGPLANFFCLSASATRIEFKISLMVTAQ